MIGWLVIPLGIVVIFILFGSVTYNGRGIYRPFLGRFFGNEWVTALNVKIVSKRNGTGDTNG